MNSVFRAGVLFLIAAALVVVWTVLSLNNSESCVELTKVPGSFEVNADEPDRYFLWDAEKTRFDGELFEAVGTFPETLKVTVKDAEGNPLEFVAKDGDAVNVGNNRHKNVGYVDVETAGKITMDLSGGNGVERVVSVGRGEQMHLLGQLIFRGITAAACAVLGIILALVGAIGRARGRSAHA